MGALPALGYGSDSVSRPSGTQNEEDLYFDIVVALDLLVSGGMSEAHSEAICSQIAATRLGPNFKAFLPVRCRHFSAGETCADCLRAACSPGT